MAAAIAARQKVGCYPLSKRPGGRGRLATLTLTIADLLTIAGAIFGPLLVIGGGALAWLPADMAKLDERQRADTAKLEIRLRDEIAKLDERQRADAAAINMRLDTLTQSIITSAIARGSQGDLPAERASQPAPLQRGGAGLTD